MRKKIINCINNDLVTIYKKTISLESLEKKIITYLPSRFADSIAIGEYQNGILLLVLNNPLLATEIRYMLPELRDNMRKDPAFYQLTQIKISRKP